MVAIGEALPWVAFWAVVGLWLWIGHKQYMAGHNAGIFTHKTDAEKRILEAKVRLLEREAGMRKDEP